MALVRKRKPQAGFTLVEVIASLGVMMVGALAIIGLQGHTIRANTHARELSTALQIAQLWSERLKQDAHTWNEIAVAGGAPTAGTVLANTLFLGQVVVAPGVFQTIPNTTATRSNGFDFRGVELDLANPGQAALTHFCASFRPQWVFFGRALRADVRVWWPRAGRGGIITADFPLCADDNVRLNPGDASDVERYNVVYMPTIVRVNPQENF